IARDVAINLLDAGAGELVGKILDDPRRRLRALSVRSERQLPAREIGIAAAYQRQVAGNAAIFIRRRRCLHRGNEAIIGADQRQCRRGSEKFEVGGGSKEFVLIEREKDLLISEREDFDPPISSCSQSLRGNRRYLFGEGLLAAPRAGCR